jgi:hypothetical protein
VVSFTLRQLYSQGKIPWYPLEKRLGGPQSRSGGGSFYSVRIHNLLSVIILEVTLLLINKFKCESVSRIQLALVNTYKLEIS